MLRCFVAAALMSVAASCISHPAAAPTAAAVAPGIVDITWSPDGRTLAYTRYGVHDVFFVGVGGGSQRSIAAPGRVGFLSWSPDGTRLAITMRESSQAADDLYVVRLADETFVRLTTDPARDTMPAWSPDGERIAFASDRTGRLQLYTIGADGGEASALVTAAEALYNPQWSWATNQIVFYSEAGDNKDQILVVEADGSRLRNLTGGEGHNYYPAWFPDGRAVAFTTTEGGQSRVYRLDLVTGARAPLAPLGAWIARISPASPRVAYVQSLAQVADGAGAPPMQLVVATATGARPRIVVGPAG